MEEEQRREAALQSALDVEDAYLVSTEKKIIQHEGCVVLQLLSLV